jgi:hypothetical protein
MPTREIPEGQWVAFLDGFSLRHEGWLVSIEVLSSDAGTQVEATDLPLVAITASRGARDANAIDITVGASAGDHSSRTVERVTSVALKQTDAGADEALEIRSEGGATTLVRFRSAMLPEMVDGLLA